MTKLFSLTSERALEDWGVNDPTTIEVNRICRELLLSKEQKIRAFLRDNRTHRMNITIEEGLPQIVGRSNPFTAQVEVAFSLKLIKPRGWVAPLP